ncbi:MAG: accessory factor UbiK family protein [Cardiobacteriaceae bacterium]|nr:accessory factor UbiK family protein [Cardiobacteriaceae bacterium]
MKTNPLSFVLDQLENHLPEALRPFNAEMKNASRRFFRERLEPFDLVPREDFDAQGARLDAALARLAALEARIGAGETPRA